MSYYPCLLNSTFSLAISIELVAIFILVLCSAFFSSCETAFSTASSIRMKGYADEKRKGARRAYYIIEHYDKTLTTILIGNNLVNICSTTLCATVFAQLIRSASIANVLNTVIMTIIVLIFGEILPKSMAKSNPDKFCLMYSGVLYFVMKILTPLSLIFGKIQHALTKNIKKQENPTMTEDELENIIDTMQEEGVLASQDADIIQGALNLSEKTVYEIMTPRVDIVAGEDDDSAENIEKIKRMFAEYQYSRIPIYKNDKDNIIGILNQKDLFNAITMNKSIKLSKMMTAPLFVSENLKINELISTMQKNKKHMAIVRDEYGGTSGLVCMEDALEEVVGEIYDEHDEASDEKVKIEKLSDNKYKVSGEVKIEDLFDTLEIEHLPETEYTNVAGFIYEIAENLPSLHSVVNYIAVDEQLGEDNNYVTKKVNLEFEVTKCDSNRVDEVILTVSQIEDEEDEKKAE